MTDPSDNFKQAFLPRYDVEGVVGEGAAAVIYRVVDRRDGSTKAIKALKAETNAEPSVVKRFEDEYRILRRLHHPSLPEVYDYGFTDERRRYMVMELVDGERLDEYFAHNPGDLWLLLYELCEVVSFIHSHNLLHLDLKPANILVKKTSAYGDEKPMVMLMDFGLSYRRDEGGEVSLVGTPEYMAPEIIRGEQELTRAADYYSLGISLYELLAGETPFRGKINDVFSGHLRSEVRFRGEKTEYAEFYPHVLGLVAKESRARLEAFEDFRRAVAGRLGGGIDELDRAYGLSFISSIGMIGKEEVWQGIRDWSDSINSYVTNRRKAAGSRSLESVPSTDANTNRRSSIKIDSGASNLTDKLLESVRRQEIVDDVVEIDPPARLVTLVGPSGSGKSYLVNELVEHCRLSGTSVWYLGSKPPARGLDEMSSVLHQPGQRPDARVRAKKVDPRSVLLDRYMDGWDRLAASVSTKGVVLVVDCIEDLDKEQIGFLEYLAKRLNIALSENLDPGIYVAVSGAHRNLKRGIAELLSIDVTVELYTIAPLQRKDIREVIDRLCGGVATVEDLKHLEDYTTRFDESAQSFTAALENALIKDALLFKAGRWQFKSPRTVASIGSADILQSYYLDLYQDLPSSARVLINWICCHRGPVSIEVLMSASKQTLTDISDSLNILESFRVVSQVPTRGSKSIELASRSVHKFFYNVIEQKRRAAIHEAYSRMYESMLEKMQAGDINSYSIIGRQLVFQYQRLDEFRKMFEAQFRLMGLLKLNQLYYELRSECINGLEVLKFVEGKEHWKHRSWHIRRYYLKCLIEAYWAAGDFSSIKNLIGEYFDSAKNGIPLSFMFKYCMSLIFMGEYDHALLLARGSKATVAHQKSEAFILARLVEAIVYSYGGEYRKTLDILEEVTRGRRFLSGYGLCRLFFCYTATYERIGDEQNTIKYNRLLAKTAKKHGFTHEYVMSIGFEFNEYFDKSMLQECKKVVRRGVSIAARKNMYLGLSRLYFMTSAVYYEEGRYKDAARYLDKAISLATSMGVVNDVIELLTRKAMIYQYLGLFGNALSQIQKAKNMWQDGYDLAKGVVVFLFDYDLHLLMNSKGIEVVRKRAELYVKSYSGKPRLGYYWYLNGIYHCKKWEMNQAIKCFRKAVDYYKQSSWMDDVARSLLKECIVLLELNKFSEAAAVIREVKKIQRKLESKNIEAEYRFVKLAYHYHKRSSRRVIQRKMAECEASFGDAQEIPLLLAIERLMVRVKLRLGKTQDARSAFNCHLGRIKKIVSNLSSEELASDFLEEPDEQLLLKECKSVIKKGTM
jgi:serine/threonine protein kinase/tetratricopeptide (TPR) repeat protein